MSFKDAFTKEDSGRSLLEYDDGAFYYFAATVVALGVIPSTYVFVTSQRKGAKVPWKEHKNLRTCGCSFCADKARDNRPSFMSRLLSQRKLVLQLVLLLLGWCALLWLGYKSMSSSMRSMSNFNPFEILNISPEATEKQIKKAFRTMSLKHHPDKNRNDPSSAAKFLLVSKAYHALTDEKAKRNFEKYGNPDGPEMLKVGIGLPQFLVQENSQVFILMVFFIVLLILVPALFITYYQRVREYASNGLKVDTVQYLATYLTERTPPRQMAQFICSAAECREIGLRQSDKDELAALSKVVTIPIDKIFKHPVVRKNMILLQAHMTRQSHLLSPGLREDQKKLLKMALPISKAVVDLATSNNWIPTIRAALDFRQHLLQAVDFDSDAMYQMPHMNPTVLSNLHQKLPTIRRPKDFRDCLVLAVENPEICLPTLKPEELQDYKEVVNHCPNIEVEAEVSVDDEEEIGLGDIAICKVKLIRQNLRDGELQGPVHAPFFPEIKFEEWFIFLTEAETGQLLGFTTLKSPEKISETEIMFPVRNPGKRVMNIFVTCDSYLMFQKIANVPFTVKRPEELKRRMFIHPEDLALDNAPTLLQTMMGGQGEGEADSDSSDEE